jgi:hypothetical protein
LLLEARLESPFHPVPPLILGQLARRRAQLKTAREYCEVAASLPMPDNWPESHKQRFLVLLHSERFQVAQQLQDIALARNALEQWMKCEPGNHKLREMYDALPNGEARP